MSPVFVLAPDSFKESMSAFEACQAMQSGIQTVFPYAQFIACPMADGGEGTVDTIIHATSAKKIYAEVMGPLNTQRITTYFALIDHGKTAVIEMAKANGIHLLDPSLRNPLITSTYGTGELIRAALDQGVSQIIITLGGSVTNDAGVGMATALGVQFLDVHRQPIPLGGGYLDQICFIDMTQLDVRLKHVEIIIATDVNNPLLGPFGATRIFGPQKGATLDMIEQLELNLAHFAKLIKQQLQFDVQAIAGSGAAGGLAAGLLAFTQARIQSGIDTVIEMTGLSKAIQQADYVFTGEGGIDSQTQFGKTPLGVARLAKHYNKPVFACAGYIGEGLTPLYCEGMTAIFGILDQSGSLPLALKRGPQNLTRTCENIARLIQQLQKAKF